MLNEIDEGKSMPYQKTKNGLEKKSLPSESKLIFVQALTTILSG